MSLCESSRGIGVQDKQTMASRSPVWGDKGGRLTVRKKLREGCFEYNSPGEEQAFEVMVVSHWLQVVGSLLLLRHVEILLLPAGRVSWDECYVHENRPFMASRLHFKLDFLDSFSCFPLWIKIFLRKHHWLSIRWFFLMKIFLSICVFWCLEGPFSRSQVPCEDEGMGTK